MITTINTEDTTDEIEFEETKNSSISLKICIYITLDEAVHYTEAQDDASISAAFFFKR